MIRVTVLSLLVCGLLAAEAGAATVTWSPGTVEPPGTPPEESCSRYAQCAPASVAVADPGGERNDLSIELVAGRVVVRDRSAALQAGAGCAAEPDGSVSCPGAQVFAVTAGPGDDKVVAPMASIDGGEGDDDLTGFNVQGGAGNDTITGTDGSDVLAGGPGADRVDARAGDDLINEGELEPAADRLDGGPGNDMLSFADRQASVQVDLGASPQAGGADGEGNEVAGFENVTGSEGADDLAGPTKPVEGALAIDGRGGNDRLFSRSPTETSVSGGAGDDELIGGPAKERLDGGAGDDRVSGSGGDDVIAGGDGDDQLDGNDGRDVITAGDGADTAVGGKGGDRISGQVGLDTLIGEDGNDVLRGGQGTDELTGGVGRDRLFGGTAGDRLDGGLNADVIDGGKGRDRMLGAEGADRLLARDGEMDRLVDGGTDRDVAIVDRREAAPNCERVLEAKRRRAARS